MRILITGASGFVMGVLLRRLLEEVPHAEVTAVDISPPDPDLRRYLGDCVGRISIHTLDIRDRVGLTSLVNECRPEIIVHGATITHDDASERARPADFVDINVAGVAYLLDAARCTGALRRFINISSAAVYGQGSGSADVRQTEIIDPHPDELYGIGKLASERIVERFAELFGFEALSLRFTKVFGPLERPTGSRSSMSLPYRFVHALAARESVRLTRRSLDATGDWISAQDIAIAIVAIVMTDRVNSGPYNLASGRLTTVRDLASLFGVHIELGEGPQAIDLDPALSRGKSGGFDVSRAAAGFAWKPRKLEDQVLEYVEWFMRSRAAASILH